MGAERLHISCTDEQKEMARVVAKKKGVSLSRLVCDYIKSQYKKVVK